MTALVLSLHLLSGAPAAPPLHLLDPAVRLDSTTLETLTPLQRFSLGQAPVDLAPHGVTSEFLLGVVGPFAVHGVMVCVEAVVLLVLVVAVLSSDGNLGDAALVSFYFVAAADLLGAPFASTYAIAVSHGDTSFAPFALGYLGAVAGEVVGWIPAVALLAVSSSHVSGSAALLVLALSVLIDAASTSAGAMLLYHLAARPFSAAPAATGVQSPAAPPPPPSYYPPPAATAPPPPVGFNVSFSF